MSGPGISMCRGYWQFGKGLQKRDSDMVWSIQKAVFSEELKTISLKWRDDSK